MLEYKIDFMNMTFVLSLLMVSICTLFFNSN